MKSADIERALRELFYEWAGVEPALLLPLAPSGSNRIYYRLKKGDKTAIGAYNPDRKENEAFIGFSRHFFSRGLPVPEIYAVGPGSLVYLQEDLGFTTLYSYLLQKGDYFPEYLIRIYKRVVEQLARLQVEGGEGLDYSLCYPRDAFDKQSMRWDFNTFKYYFLRLAGVPFDEQLLENDMEHLADYLLEADSSHFMFRDFQTRNIMIRSGEPYFIDYQGGRRGALQYDLASLLYQAKANIPDDIRIEMLEHYMDSLEKMLPIDRRKFVEYYYAFVFVRSIQVLGAYGFRGLYERKEYFINSIPFALRNVKWLLDNKKLAVQLPELEQALYRLIESKRFEPFDRIRGASSLLTVRINSFSYNNNGIPPDPSGNGGGFVFDCRFIHNPGRYEPYKKLTGRDEAVINFLKLHSQADDFMNDVFRIVDAAVEDYIERSFTSLMVSFGCTGGQHRSVYAADTLARHIREKFGVRVELSHIEQEKKGWRNE